MIEFSDFINGWIGVDLGFREETVSNETCKLLQ